MKTKRRLGAILAVVLVALVLFGALYEGWKNVSNIFEPITISKTTSITVQTGENSEGLANDLYQKGLIHNILTFRIWARIEDLDSKLQAGTYVLTPSMSMDQVITRIESGISDAKSLLVIEGWRLEQIANAANQLHLVNFKEQDFLNYVKKPSTFPDKANYPILKGLTSMEGLLFPATYAIPLDANATKVVDIMLDQFNQIAQQDNLVALAKQHGLSEYQMVILASLVQREVRFTVDMGNVASVYWNRIEKPNLETGGALDSDPTVQYARDTDSPPKNVSLYWSSLATDGKDIDPTSPYNTYIVTGWPPTPISIPGELALKAAAAPPTTQYYFFLAKPDGHNVYAATYANFSALEQQYYPNGN